MIGMRPPEGGARSAARRSRLLPHLLQLGLAHGVLESPERLRQPLEPPSAAELEESGDDGLSLGLPTGLASLTGP